MAWAGGKGGATPTGQSFFGVISSIGPKFGFIKARPVEAQYGCDVFVPAMSLQGHGVGETVDFELAVNAQGKPQALNVRGKGGGKGCMGKGMGGFAGGYGQQAGGWSPMGKAGGKGQSEPLGSFFGEISSIGPKYGFIKCPPVFAKFGSDTFCPGGGLVGCSVGDSVDFELVMNEQGKPQATQVRRKGGGKGFGGFPGGGFDGKGYGKGYGKGAGVQGKSMGKHRGIVSSIGGKYGFIKSDAITEKYGTDVFVPIAELWGCQSGSEVSFELVESDKGKPQARNIVSSGGSGSGLKGTSTGEFHMGKVSRAGGKFGFLKCETVQARFGDTDIFVPGGAMEGLREGDSVTFELFINEKDQPQAGFLTKAGGPAPTATGETHVGTVSAVGGKFGFIECDETKAKYNSDVFCSGGLLTGLSKGTSVSFELGVSAKGQPQAMVVTATEPAAKRARTS